MIKVAADKYLFHLEEMLPDGIDLQLYDPENGFPNELKGIEALLIRTVIPINSDTIGRLPNSLSFIGTGSAGTDHVDTNLLNEKNITFSNAAGCNARSVAEYVCTALLIWSDQRKVNLTNKTVGIVGVGNVGSQLNSMLGKLGVSTICYDPPREVRDSTFSSATPAEVLSADILTFHTPLTKSGDYPSHHWLDADKISNHHFDLVINTARGGVVDEEALLQAKADNRVSDFIIDVWENEPLFSDEVAQKAFIYTPHIAGYSIQAKARATALIVQAMCEHCAIPFLSKSPTTDRKINIPDFDSTQLSLSEILRKIHPIKQYQNRLDDLLGKPPKEKGPSFNSLRAQFPLRDEYQNLIVSNELVETYPVLLKLGLQLPNC